MNKITENTEASQGEIKEPVTVQAAIEDLIFDYSNLQHWVSVDACKLEAIEFLKQHPEIKYANETARYLKASHDILRGVACGLVKLDEIVDAFTAMKSHLNKIEGAV